MLLLTLPFFLFIDLSIFDTQDEQVIPVIRTCIVLYSSLPVGDGGEWRNTISLYTS